MKMMTMSFMVHFDFEKGSQNQHFQSSLLVRREGGGHRKQYSVYALDNVDNIILKTPNTKFLSLLPLASETDILHFPCNDSVEVFCNLMVNPWHLSKWGLHPT